MKYLKIIVKIIFAGLLSIIILSVFMCFYSLTPVHIENTLKNTDYIWPANSIWVKMNEGISYGQFDTNGYNNLSAIDNPDIIVVGSSHMEAMNVMQDQNTSYYLGKRLEGKYTVYNHGISGHDFYKVCQYIPANITHYDQKPKVLIIETSTVAIDRESVEKALNGTVEFTPSHSTGFISFLQKIPFLRVAYMQVEGGLLDLFLASSNQSKPAVTEKTAQDYAVDNQAYKKLFTHLSQLEKQYGTQIIIFYHPTGTLNPDGSIEFDSSPYLTAFTDYSSEYSINLVDMAPSFEKLYYNEHKVAHGFITGEIESGHINDAGHSTIADALYEEVMKLEKAGELCQ